MDAGEDAQECPGCGALAAVTAGVAHSCALTALGCLYCWGLNDAGQVDPFGPSVASAPVRASGRFLAVALGARHTCAALEDETVLCWGDNTDGQLASEETSERGPVAVSGAIGPFVAAGARHTCAASAIEVLCWGANDLAQLGLGSVSASNSEPSAVTGIVGSVASLSAGRDHTCAVVANQVLCWGDNALLQAGLPGVKHTATQVGTVPNASDVEAGLEHTCAIAVGGEIWCWGSTLDGRLGEADPPTQPLGAGIVGGLVSAGAGHTCAATAGPALTCWGDNRSGQIDPASTDPSILPPLTRPEWRVTSIAAGARHTVIVDRGTLTTLGMDDQGQLGDGDAAHAVAAIATPVFPCPEL